MKKYTLLNTLLAATLFVGFAYCGSKSEAEIIPAAPTSLQQVKDFIKGKELQVIKAGQYGMTILNDEPEIEWIDTTVQKNRLTLRLMNELGNWRMKFLNDTACTIISNETKYTGTWTLDDQAEEDEKPGIHLRLKYEDPEFNAGIFEGSPVTYTYIVKAVSEKNILLELPRELNRRKLVSLLKIQ